MQEGLLIVTGPMRSGTTLLSDLLYASYRGRPRHPRLAFANDDLVSLRKLMGAATRMAGIGCPLMLSEVPPRLVDAWRYLGGNDSAIEDLADEIKAACPTPESPRWVGLKNTALLPELMLLAAADGIDLRTIIVIRDPRDCYCSYIARHEMVYAPGDDLRDNADFLAFLNAYLFSVYLRAEDRIPSGRLMFVTYEELTGNLAATIRKILAFLSLSPAEYDWESVEHGKVVSNSSYIGIGANDVAPDMGITPSTGNFHNMDPVIQSMLEDLLAPVFEHFGYERLRPPAPWHSRYCYDFMCGVARVAKIYGYCTTTLDQDLKRMPGYRMGRALWATSDKAREWVAAVRAGAVARTRALASLVRAVARRIGRRNV